MIDNKIVLQNASKSSERLEVRRGVCCCQVSRSVVKEGTRAGLDLLSTRDGVVFLPDQVRMWQHLVFEIIYYYSYERPCLWG